MNSDKIYINQPYRLLLQSDIDLTNAINVQINYQKPDGVTTGTFSGTVSSSSSIYHDVTASENNIDGDWKFQISAQLTIGGDYYPGETFTLKVWKRFT